MSERIISYRTYLLAVIVCRRRRPPFRVLLIWATLRPRRRIVTIARFFAAIAAVTTAVTFNAIADRVETIHWRRFVVVPRVMVFTVSIVTVDYDIRLRMEPTAFQTVISGGFRVVVERNFFLFVCRRLRQQRWYLHTCGRDSIPR